jgi:hypothetical protein
VRTQLGVLISGVLFAWLVASYPAWKADGAVGLLMSSSAALLCLVPAVVTFLWGLRAMTGTPAERLQHAVFSTLLRMGFVLGGAVVLYISVPAFQRNAFWLWVIGFYMGTLALETVLLNFAPGARAPGPTEHKSAGA